VSVSGVLFSVGVCVCDLLIFFPQALYTDAAGLRTAFAEHWAHVASALAGEPAVLAHDLLNEPWPGDTNRPNFTFPNIIQVERSLILPFYRAIAAAIRKVDRRHIIAYEPVRT